MLLLDDQQRFAFIDPSFSTPRLLSLAAIPSGPSLIASNPAGGWVVTYTPDPVASPGAPIRLALIDASGKATPFGPTYQNAYVTGLAVSPDGTMLAVAFMDTTASILVTPMPGHSGSAATWRVGDAANEIISLSWAPDDKRLTYLAGLQTGAGIGGAPSTLDTSNPRWAPTTSTWPANTGCDETAVSWLGTDGGFAVVEECASTGVAYRRADATTGASLSPTIALPRVGCGMPPMHPSGDGSNVLIPWCGTLYLISDGAATPIGQHVVDAAWGG